MRFDHVLTTLKVISSLQEGHKLSCRSGIVSIDKKPNSFIRWITGDSRSGSLAVVYAVVNEALIVGATKELNECVDGLKTLKVTYSGDEATVAYIDIILDKIASGIPETKQKPGVSK